MKESKLIPEYQEDEKGLFADTEEGKFRPIDFEDGHLITLNSFTLMQRAFNRARIMNTTIKTPAKYT